jgi:hypothetical protein
LRRIAADLKGRFLVTPLFKKLNLGSNETVLVINAPESFESELSLLSGIEMLRKPSRKTQARFAIGFAVKQAELDRVSAALASSTDGDAIVWVAYPKGTSKKYKCEFNRDHGWSVLGDAGFEPVRQVAIDDDWSALRFRRTQYIGSMTRKSGMAISKLGKRRTRRRTVSDE